MANINYDLISMEEVKNSVQVKDLRTELEKAIKCLESIEKSTWDYAKVLYKIEENRMYDGVYKNKKEFCEKLRIKYEDFIKKCTAVKVLKDYLEPNGYAQKDFTFYKAYYLYSGLGDENLQNFLDYEKAKGRPLEKFNVNQTLNEIKVFYQDMNEAVDGTTGEAPEKEEKPEKPETEVKALKKGLRIKFDEKTYFIKWEDLANYEVKTTEK